MPLQPKQQPPYYKPGMLIKEYTALLTQAGTAAPTTTILQNTIGDIIWTRDGAGAYIATLTAAFPEGKTYISIENNFSSLNTNIGYRNNDDEIQIDIATMSVSAGTLIYTPDDNQLFNTPIQIKVYV